MPNSTFAYEDGYYDRHERDFYVTGTRNSYGYSSSATYDYKFGQR